MTRAFRSPWTDAQHAILREGCAKGWRWKRIAKATGRTIRACQSESEKLGFSRENYRFWTDEEMALFKSLRAERLAPARIAAAMTRKLGRKITEARVRNKIARARKSAWEKEESPGRPFRDDLSATEEMWRRLMGLSTFESVRVRPEGAYREELAA